MINTVLYQLCLCYTKHQRSRNVFLPHN